MPGDENGERKWSAYKSERQGGYNRKRKVWLCRCSIQCGANDSSQESGRTPLVHSCERKRSGEASIWGKSEHSANADQIGFFVKGVRSGLEPARREV